MSFIPRNEVGLESIGKPYGKTVGVAILGFKAPETTRATLLNHQAHGLYRLFDDAVICYQRCTEEDRKIAEACAIRCVARPDNLGIQGGFRWIWETLKTDYMIVLENDFPVCVSADSMKAQLTAALQYLEEGKVDLVRLRNRYNPGAQNRFAAMYSRFWPIVQKDPRWNQTETLDETTSPFKKWIRRCLRPGKATRWCGRSPYIEAHPDQLFPKYIQQIAPDFYSVDSWVLPWTNQSTLISHALMGKLLDFADAHPSSHFVNAEHNRLQTLEPPLNRLWWRRQHFRIGLPEGVFTHQRIDR